MPEPHLAVYSTARRMEPVRLSQNPLLQVEDTATLIRRNSLHVADVTRPFGSPDVPDGGDSTGAVSQRLRDSAGQAFDDGSLFDFALMGWCRHQLRKIVTLAQEFAEDALLHPPPACSAGHQKCDDHVEEAKRIDDCRERLKPADRRADGRRRRKRNETDHQRRNRERQLGMVSVLQIVGCPVVVHEGGFLAGAWILAADSGLVGKIQPVHQRILLFLLAEVSPSSHGIPAQGQKARHDVGQEDCGKQYDDHRTMNPKVRWAMP